MKITLQQSDFGAYETVAENGESVLVQTDYDFPSLAATFGWDKRTVREFSDEEIFEEIHDQVGALESILENRTVADEENDVQFPLLDVEDFIDVVRPLLTDRYCNHDSTDGTVDCGCGVTTSDFIGAARDFLDSHCGESVDDPGYFSGE